MFAALCLMLFFVTGSRLWPAAFAPLGICLFMALATKTPSPYPSQRFREIQAMFSLIVLTLIITAAGVMMGLQG